MMQVQKGQVRYKDRNDIICTYGSVADQADKKYFFLDEKLPNGLILVTTELIEAIDPMVPATHIGVVNNDGKEIIAPVNKSIKVVSDTIFVVEKTTPVTQSVIDAVNIRKDPLSATKLVTTVAGIKDKFTAIVGSEGKYIVNDQFSEAGIYDLDGKELLNGELYSFVLVNGNFLYLSKNTVDSEIVKFDLVKKEIVSEGEAKEKVADKPPVVDIKPDESKKIIDDKDAPKEEKIEDKKEEVSEKKEEIVPKVAVLPKTEEVSHEEEETIDEKEEEIDVDSLLHPVDFSNFEDDFEIDSLNLKSKEAEKPVESKDMEEDPFFRQTAETINKLICQNKDQRDIIAVYEEKIESLTSFKRKAFEENKNLVSENETLKKQIKSLEARLNEEVRKKDEYQDEINELKQQVIGKKELAKVLADAQNLLDSEKKIV